VIRTFAISGLIALSSLVPTLAQADEHDHAGDIAVSALDGKLVTGGSHFETHGVDGYNIYEADFGDLAGGPWTTKNPGFQTQGGATLTPYALISFAGLGSLSFWDGASWGTAPTGVGVSIADVLQDALTTWSATGVTPGETSYVAQVSAAGTIHDHLALSVTPNATAGAYLIQLQLTSDAYASSDPFYLVFNRGLSSDAFEASVDALTTPVPEPASYALLIAGLAGVGFLMRRRHAATDR